MSDNAVQRVPHLMGDASIYHFQSLILHFLVVVQNGLGNVDELEQNLLLVFLKETFQLNLDVVDGHFFDKFRLRGLA